MELVLNRHAPIGLALPGEMFIAGLHACYTLENYTDAIPEGRYEVVLYPSPSWNRMMPLLKDVPGRSYIEIHYGNYPEDYRGCIGVGQTQDPTTGDIFQTQAMFNALFPAIESACENEGCWIQVFDPLDNSEEVMDCACGEN